MAQVNARYFIQQQKFAGATDEDTLTKALLTQPDKINPVLTHLMGKDDNKFPLTFLSEGQVNGVRTIEVDEVEYYWDVIGLLSKSDTIASHGFSSGDKIGIGNAPFQIVMKGNVLREHHTVHTPNGIALRVQRVPERVAGGYKVTFTLAAGGNSDYVPYSELAVGTKLSMVGGATGPQSYSFGNSSNVETPGKMKNQISLLRKSYELAGNISNKFVNVEFDIPGKGVTRKWIDFERWQHMLNWRQDQEEHLWYSKYNRLADGTIPLIDEQTGKPIPIGAGLLDQIFNKDTYTDLTIDKIKNTVTNVFYGATDVDNMEVVLFTGQGGREAFHEAIMSSGSWSHVSGTQSGNLFVSGSPNSNNLVFGAYFGAYKHVNGNIIRVQTIPMYDHGGQAQNSPKHYKSGRPLESYRMTFVDVTKYDNQNNLVMVTQRGRGQVTGVLKGMNTTPYDFAGNNNMNIASEQDKSSIHFLATKGICLRRATHCFDITCDAAA
jgi:hypothetical protein